MGAAFPLIAGLALTAGGTAANMAGANKVKKQTEGFLNAETARQRQNVDQGWNVFNKSLGQEGAQGATQAIEQGAAHRAGIASDIPSTTYDTTKEPLMKGSGSVSPGSDLGREMSAKYRMGGLSEMQLRDMIRNLDTQTQLNAISHRARSSANILPYELEQAQQSGDGLRNAGGVMSGLGSMLGMYGAFSGLGNAGSVAAPTVDQSNALLAGFGPLNAGTAAKAGAASRYRLDQPLYQSTSWESYLR